MAYNEDKKPDPHYTVQVRIIEVTPAYKSTSAAGMVERTADEVVNITVRAASQAESIARAIAQLEVAGVA